MKYKNKIPNDVKNGKDNDVGRDKKDWKLEE